MKLLVILTTFTVCLDLISAKSNTSANQEAKAKASSKLNSLSTTPKPDQYASLLQQQQQQQQQQQYRQQSYPQQPLPPLYQIQTQNAQRQLHGPTQQQILLQQAQGYQPQTSQLQLQQAHLQQAQLQQAQLQQAQLQQAQLQQAQQAQQAQAAYHAQLQAQFQPQLQQVIQKAYIVPQQQNRPAAMILIAQPAYVPQNVAYSGAGQQFLNYVQPQARYLVQGNNQAHLQQIPQQTPANTIGYQQVVAVPTHYQQNVVAAAPQATQHQPSAVAQPSPLQLAQIAQIATQQYSRINPAPQQQHTASSSPYSYQSEPRVLQQDLQAGPAVGSIPPIITGFENFTPEQQEKIKVQLSEYFGAPLKPLPNSGIPSNLVQDGQGQGQAKGPEVQRYIQKYQGEQSRLSTKEFVPSEQVKEDVSASSSNVLQSHYARA